MGQHWKFINLDRMESWEPKYRSGPKMGEFMYDTHPALLRCLVSDSGGMFDPVHGRWAGDRIICLGDYAADLPLGVITEDDQWLIDKLLGKGHDDEDDNEDEGSEGEDGNEDEGSEDEDVHEDEDDYEDEDDNEFEDNNETLCHRLYYKVTLVSITEMLWSNRRLWVDTSDICPPNSVWALRNISKKEFVRSDKAICGSKLYWKDGFHDAFLDFPGLFQVLTFRTGWSEDPNCAAVYNDSKYVPPQGQKILMNEGTWAGDRIDMVMVDDGGVELKNEGWKDVSRDACTQMRDIFHAEDCIF